MAAPKNHAKAGGRKAGVPNKVTRELKEIAQSYGPAAIETANKIMTNVKIAAAARISAANLILDRAYGKAPQAVQMSGPGGGPVQTEDVTITDEMRARAVAALMAKVKAKAIT